MRVKATLFCSVLFSYFACILCIISPSEPTLTVGTPVTPDGETSDFFSIGDTAQLICTIDPAATRFLATWRILGTTTALVDPVNIAANAPPTNIVLNVIINDTSVGDDYQCFGVDVDGMSGNVTAVFTININPFFTVTPDANVLITNGTDSSLTCEADGVPTPDVQLVRVRDGSVLSQGNASVNVFGQTISFGDYQCIANITGADQTAVFNFTVIISPLGIVSTTPENVILSRGDNVTFTCQTDAGPDTMYLWFYNVSDLACESSNCENGVVSNFNASDEDIMNAVQAMNPVLNLTNIAAPENGGEYICIAVNDAGVGLSTSTLYVVPEFLEEPQDIKTEDGEVVYFTCLAESFPFPAYQWERLVNGQFEIVSGENGTVLQFSPVSYTDAGVYRCVVTNTINNTLNTIESQNATLFVSPLGIVSTTPENVILSRGDNVIFTCQTFAGPDTIYLWFYNVSDLVCVSSDCENGVVSNFNASDEDIMNAVLTMNPVLNLTNITAPENGGEYICIAVNDAGVGLSTSTLYVVPEFLEEPQDIKTEDGEVVYFTCLAESFPFPAYQWERLVNGQFEIVSGENGTVLLFSPVSYTDAGVYRCVVTNTINNTLNTIESQNATLFVSPINSVMLRPMVYVNQGDEFNLTCTAQGGPNNYHQWTLDGTGVMETGVLSITSSSSDTESESILLVTSVDAATHQGIYTCNVSNTAGYEARSSRVVVSPLGIVSTTPENVILSRGDNVIFTCQTDAGPDTIYLWLYNVSDLVCESSNCENGVVSNFNASDEDIMNAVQAMNPVLNLTNITAPENGGEYICIAVNDAGVGLSTSTLYVVPEFLEEPQDIKTEDGEVVYFTCLAESFPFPAYQWERLVNGQFEIVSGENGTVLQFSPVSYTDAGVYRCVVTNTINNTLNTIESQNATLFVSPLGIVSTTPENVILSRGDNVIFTCQTFAGPDTIYLWFYNVSDLVCVSSDCENGVVSDLDGSGEDIMNAVLTMNPVFNLTNITAPENGGEYICIAVNDAGAGMSTSTLYVIPEFLQEPQDIKTEDGVVESFTCLAESFPFPVYQWERLVNGELEVVSGENGTVLQFNPVSYTDAGVYRCVVTNTINNTLNTIESQNATLFVSPRGSVVLQPMVYVNQGDEFNLTCSAEGGPNNVHQWTQDETDVLSITSSSSDTVSESILRVTSVDAAIHQGIYTCNVSNMAGYESNTSRVVVSPLEIVSTTPENVILSRGDNVTFTCQTDAGPDTIYLWFYNVSDLVCESSDCENGVVSDLNGSGEDIMNAVLTMNPVFNLTDITAPENGGEYICIAVNDAGVGLSTSELNVLLEFVEQPQSINATVPSSFNLTCLAESFPYPSYQWQMMNRGTLMFEDIDGENRTTLEFDPVDFSDFGLYRCVATNTINGEEYTNTSEASLITISPQGSIMLSPQNMTFDYAMTAILTCTIEGGPNNIFYWYLNDTLIIPDGQSITIVNQTFSSILTILSISAPLHGGTYQCVASNAAGADDVSTYLFVSPRFIQQPVQTLLTRNNDIEMLTCLAESFPDPQYQWFYITNGSLVVEEPVLPFIPVMFGDEGIYQCSVSSNNLTIYSIEATVYVSPLGSLQLTEEEINAEEGDDITTICSALGGLNNSFQWTYLRTDEEITASAELERSVVTVLDGGCYECFVSNLAGYDIVVFTLNIGPLIVEQPEDLNVTRGNSIMLSCTATGFPIPYIIWRHNDTDIDAKSDPRIQIYTLPFESQSGCPRSGSGSGRESGSESGSESRFGSGSGMDDNFGMVTSLFMVDSTVFLDSGDYQCVTNNPNDVYNDTESEIVRVLVQDVPDIPVNLDANNVTSRNLTLIWTAPHDNNAPILGYSIFYSHPSFIEGGDDVTVITDGRMAELFIEDLHPGVTYNFTVLAFNEEGSSNRSEPFNIRTLEEAPDAPPTETKASALSPTDILVTWQLPLEEDRNGIILSYDIKYIALDDNGLPILNMTDGTQIILANLLEFTNYSISVLARTAVGPGPFSDEMIVILAPPGRVSPAVIDDSEIGSTTAIIRWNPPIDPNGEITSYTVEAIPIRFREDPYDTDRARRQIEENVLACTEFLNIPAMTSEIVGGNSRSVNLTGLIPFTIYEVRVAASTVVGRGNFSSIASFATAVDDLAPILELQGVVRDLTSIVLSWEGPACPNGIITGYYIYYRISNTIQPQPIDNTGYTEDRLISSERDVVYLITDLSPRQYYAIHVRAFSIDDNDTELIGMVDTEILVVLQLNESRLSFESRPNTGVHDTSIGLPSANVFSDIGIENIIYYGVIIVPDPDMDFNSNVDDFNSTYPNVQPYESRGDNRYYIAAAWNDVSEVPNRFTAGDESRTMAMRSDVNETYFNAKLDRFTPHCYYVIIHHILSIGDEVVIRYYELTCRDTRLGYNLIALIVCLILAFLILCCLVIFIIICCCCWYRRRQSKYPVSKKEEALSQLKKEPEIIFLNPYFSTDGNRQPIPVEDYPAYVAQMHSNQDYLFTEEYSQIEPDHHPTRNASTTNKEKDRYLNIPAYDHSRVLLKHCSSGSDYINANYIVGYEKSGNFIATQGPMPSTTNDFWCMIWEQNVPIIVMLTNLEERGKIKCHKYWPNSPDEGENTADYGEVHVELLEEAEQQHQTIRTLSLRMAGSEAKTVKQYHFISWPDHGVPLKYHVFLNFLQVIMNDYNSIDGGPIVVHCSAGVGRTGAFIGLSVEMARAAEEKMVDIYNYVQYMRKQRPSMILNETEYIFIHNALLEAIKLGMIEGVAKDGKPLEETASGDSMPLIEHESSFGAHEKESEILNK